MKPMVLFLLFFLSVFAEASSRYSDTVYVKYSSVSFPASNYGSYPYAEGQGYGTIVQRAWIVVRRGCREESFPVTQTIPYNATEEQLLAIVYGAEPLEDSSEVYRDWARSCMELHAAGDASEGWFYVIFGAVYGVPATLLGKYLTFRDYDYVSTAILGRVPGVILLVTGGLMVICGAIALVPSIISLFDEPPHQADIYNKQYERWKLRVTPTINFNEPGGGLLLQLGF